MNSKRKNDPNSFLHIDTVASTTECTGLIPTPPANEAEAESYTQLYPVPKPREAYPPRK